MKDSRIVGIITFHRSYNCGSLLQAYALQKVLRDKFGIENQLIDFSNSEQKRMYSILFKPHNIKDFLRNLLNLTFYRVISRHNYDYEKFINSYLNYSGQKYTKISELNEKSLGYDLYITGSDQVWNLRAKDFDDAYFLPFVQETPKIAYAVSLGATNPNLMAGKNKYADYVRMFDGVSVREENAQRWVEELSGKSVELCLDPTLLLKPEEWNEITGEAEVKEKYLFWYAMTYKKDVMNVVIKIAKKCNLPIYVLDAKEWSRRGLFMHGIKLAPSGGPSAYLSMVKNAEIVITSSFHGTVFCSVFKKNFWYLNIHDNNTQDDRASFLLKQLGLSDRYLNKQEILNANLLELPNYQACTNISKEIESSMDYLGRYLNQYPR